MSPSGLLDGFDQVAHLGAFLFIRRGDFQGQQMPERVHGDMHFGAFAPLVAIVTASASALRRGLQRAPVENDRCGLIGAARAPAQQDAQVMREGFKAASLDPTLGLLINRGPRRQVIGHHSPGTTGFDHVADRVEDDPRGVVPLRRIFLEQGEVRSAKRPFFIADITVVTDLPTGLFSGHPKLDARMYLHSTALSPGKFITGSRG